MRFIKHISIIFFISITILLNAQDQYVDSLVNYAETANDDTNKVKCFHKLFFEMEYVDIQLAEEYANQAIALSQKINFARGTAFSYVCLGYLEEDQGKFSEALEWFQKSLTLYREIDNKKGISRGLRNISGVYMSQGHYAKALDYCLQSLKISEDLENKKMIALDYTNIGAIYHGMEDYPRALEFFLKSLKLSEELGISGNTANDLCNVGVAYKEMEDYPKALVYYFKSAEVAEEFNKTKSLLAVYSNIGGVYADQKENKKALQYYNKARKIAEDLSNNSTLSIVLANIGSVYIYLKEYNAAEKILKEALAVAEETESISTKKMIHEFLSDLYEETREFEKAHVHFKEYSNLKDTIFNIEKYEDMTRNELTYEFDKKEAVLKAEQEKETAVALADKKRQNLFIWFLSFIVVAITIIALIVLRTLKLTKKQKTIIENQKEIVEEKNKEIVDSINYAKRIQSAILPPDKILRKLLKESFILYKPKAIVAGDFYWLECKEGKTLFAAADCTGHGVPGAMVSVICNNGLNRAVREYGITDPGKILDKTREIVIQEFEKSEDDVKDGMDIALCSIEGNKLEYAGAHNPLWIIRNGELIETKANKQPIGKFEKQEPYTTHTFDLQKGDSLYIFSDGYVDQFGGEKGKKFKSTNLKKLLISIWEKPMEEQKKIIDKTFIDWKGDMDQIDDVCLMGVRI